MPEQRATPLPQDPLHELAQGPLLPRDEWAGLQVLDGVRERFDRFLSGLEGTEKSDFVRLQKAHIQAQSDLEAAIEQLANTFEQQALASLREGLKSLTGQDIDPKLAHIHTRYLKPANRVRRAESGDQIAVASLTLWEAACMNYGGLTGWSYPGNTGLKEASYLDTPIKASAGAFIDLVRRLNLGSQLRQALERALRPASELGARLMGFARAEFEFAQVEALNNVALSRVDLDKYRWLQRAQNGEVPWGKTEEMQLFISDGADSTGWLPQDLGFMGLYKGKPKGDYLSIPHVIFSIEGCPGVFSYFPNRPGGTLRHHTHATEAAREFYVAFHGAFQRGHVDWLYKSLALSDCARLKRITQSTPKPPGLNLFAEFLFDLSRHLPTLTPLEKIGYQRQLVNRAPVDSLYDIYLQRCRSNLQALAHQTPGLMPTLIEFFQTLFNEIIELLLIPAPGALRGLGRVRQVAMFAVLAKGLADAGVVVSQGHSGEALQTFVDLADLLISSRLHTRLALTVRRRHQGLYRRLSQQYRADAAPLTDSRKLQRMLGNSAAPARDLAVVLKSSDTSTTALSQVWDGARPSAALVEAAQRFNADRLIDWIANPEAHERPPLGAFHALGPLLTQVAGWPQDTSLRIQSPGGELLRCYSRGPGMGTVRTLEVTLLENHQFAYSNPRRVTDYLPTAVLALLPSSFLFGETAATLQSRTRQLRRLLADQASAVRGALFDALTRFAELPRGVVADPQVKPLLAELTSREQALPTVIEKLHRLHPYLSLARLVEVLAPASAVGPPAGAIAALGPATRSPVSGPARSEAVGAA
ncbi:hypothetical protein JWR97_08735 [Pseudomonas cedrina subsp. fulgida]|nr:hypothetical protein [Pseudomonas cedrina subsp. fulgida]